MVNSDSNELREVNIIKRKTSMSSDDFFQITLKSPDESVDTLLEKAITAMEIQNQKEMKNELELMK